MRTMPRPAAIAAVVGVALATLALITSLSANQQPAAAQAGFHQVVPALAGDSSAGASTYATATPTRSATATATTTPANACGSGHDTLRTFTDAGAASLERGALDVTVPQLVTTARPASLPTNGTRTGPVETTFYNVTANLVSMNTGPGGSWEIVLDNGGGVTMRASFPAQGCIGSLSNADQGALNGARTAFRTQCGEPPASGSKAITGHVRITGPGFWGSKAVDNAANNGIEIGPIFAFSFTDAGSCDPNKVTPTPVPTTVPLANVIVGVDHDQGTGYHPGDTIVATVLTYPVVAGVSCEPQYVSPPPPGSLVGSVVSDPGLVTKLTGADGKASWSFKVPADSPAGTSPTGGRFTARCTQGDIQKEAIVGVTIHVP